LKEAVFQDTIGTHFAAPVQRESAKTSAVPGLPLLVIYLHNIEGECGYQVKAFFTGTVKTCRVILIRFITEQ
jgi:hypothetical protein